MVIRLWLSEKHEDDEKEEEQQTKMEDLWNNLITYFRKEFGITNNVNEDYNETRIVVSVLYVYLYIVLDKARLIQNKIDFWCPNSIDNLLFLPLEGIVNLGYFQYLISPNKEMYCKEVIYNKEENDFGQLIRFKKDEITSISITQFDCGYIDKSNKNTSLRFSDLVEMISVLKGQNNFVNGNVYDYNNYKNLLEISTDWLKLFHIFTADSKTDNAKIKIKKVLYDTSCYFSGKNEFPREKFTCCRILGKSDECNYMVNGILYPNLYGTVTSCIKSIAFRELNLETIHYLEGIRKTVMSHLGEFVSDYKSMLNSEKLDHDTKKAHFERTIKMVEDYKLKSVPSDSALRNNALIQIVAWEFISEIYSHLKVEVVVCEYLKNNDAIIRDTYGYSPDKVPVELEVYLDSLEIVTCNPKCEQCQDPIENNNLEYFYRNQSVFKNKDIKSLIEITKGTILKFFSDTHLNYAKKHCSLRQFMTVSLLLVKRQKRKEGLANIPEFKYYNSQKRSLSVRTLLTDPDINCTLKDVAFASKIMDYQNHVFIKTSHVEWYNDLAILSYKKIINFFEEKIPILKTGEKSKATNEDASLEERITPLDLLISAYDITVNLFDKLLDDLS